MPQAEKLRKVITDSVKANAAAYKKLALDIHSNPELGLEEHKACKWQVELLKKLGFKVKTPYAKLETAYLAEFGGGRPAVAFLSEYDALPKIGHGCGHNLICTASIAAGKALADAVKADKIRGKVVIVGTPAEEGFGGKAVMVDHGVFKNIDMAIMGHPLSCTKGWTGSIGAMKYKISFTGKSAHASGEPHRGINALDAIRLLFTGVDAWRQQLPEDARVHGIINDGGAAPNIIPDSASCTFYIRSVDDAYLDTMVERFMDIVRGAALMTAAKYEITPIGHRYRGPCIAELINESYLHYAKLLKMNPVFDAPAGRGSTDFCNVSQVVPAAHVNFGMTRKTAPVHSVGFRDAAGTDYAVERTLLAAEAMANTGYDFLTDEKMRNQMRSEFETKRNKKIPLK